VLSLHLILFDFSNKLESSMIRNSQPIYPSSTGYKIFASPNFMFEQAEDWSDDGEDGRFLVLYEMNNFTGHWCGLVQVNQNYSLLLSSGLF
jgi:hypothetical protein